MRAPAELIPPCVLVPLWLLIAVAPASAGVAIDIHIPPAVSPVQVAPRPYPARAIASSVFLEFDRVRVRTRSGTEVRKDSPGALELELGREGGFELWLDGAGPSLSGSWRGRGSPRRTVVRLRADEAAAVAGRFGAGTVERAELVLRRGEGSARTKCRLKLRLRQAGPGGDRRRVRAVGWIPDPRRARASSRMLRFGPFAPESLDLGGAVVQALGN